MPAVTPTHQPMVLLVLLHFGVGTSQVRDLYSPNSCISPLKVKRIDKRETSPRGICTKDVILHIIRKLGVNGGTGFTYEYAGEVFDNFSMEERMTACNMSIEGGARVGYVNPDQKTFDYLEGRPYSPTDSQWDTAVENWKSMASDPGCDYDDIVYLEASGISPTVTWGINPAQAISVEEKIPEPDQLTGSEETGTIEALEYMKLDAGAPIKGTPVDVAFIGSCFKQRNFPTWRK